MFKDYKYSCIVWNDNNILENSLLNRDDSSFWTDDIEIEMKDLKRVSFLSDKNKICAICFEEPSA